MNEITKTCVMFLALFYVYAAMVVYVCVCVFVYNCHDPMAFVRCPLCTLDCVKIIEL